MEAENKRFLALMTSAHFINDGFEMIVPTLLPTIAAALALSYAQIGVIGGSMMVAMGLGQAAVGAGSDYFGHKKALILAGIVSTSLSFILMAASQSYEVLLLANLLAGFGLSIYHPVGVAMISNKFGSRQGKAMGIHGSGGNAGMFLFPLLAGIMADMVGWRYTLAFFPLLGFGIALLYALMVREEPCSLSKFEPRKLLVPVLAVIIVSLGLFDMSCRGFVVYFPVTLGDIGISSTRIGIYFSLYFGIGILGQYFGGIIADAYDRRISLAVLTCIAGASMYGALWHPYGAFMVAALLVSGLAVHMIWPIFFVMYAHRTPPSLRGTGMGLFFSMGYLIGAAAPVIIGYVGTQSTPQTANYLVPVTAVLAAIAIMTISKLGAKTYD